MQSYFTNVRIIGQWGQYVSMLFAKLCRDDASRRNRVEPTKQGKQLCVFFMRGDSMGGQGMLRHSTSLLDPGI